VAVDALGETAPLLELVGSRVATDGGAVEVVDALPQLSWLAELRGDEAKRLHGDARAAMEARLQQAVGPLAAGLPEATPVEPRVLDGAFFRKRLANPIRNSPSMRISPEVLVSHSRPART